ncbi:NAD(P)H-dependent oxidoreductase [Consotaella salsifontis]|uniref:Putative NADPH-quinone reductase (Modulator of drug activity B) n=1 Tax=Consotaella salsifontis TaxID=1365950 RepID=A0A1T4SXT5_9HYPH|nr:NAD(P)H-dependent oxidoreductase [Consotaella salsifontis]SKA32728.1 Putative NADPH-quinone reductase (modulator of drug activity B) [Consotaella salsifontis]
MAHVLLIQGHPDPDAQRLSRRLALAYQEGAEDGGHDVITLDLASLNFPMLRSTRDGDFSQAPGILRFAQDELRWCDHLGVFFPIWHGAMPALLKAFWEQVLRPGFAFELRGARVPRKLLDGRSARIVATMGMPALAFRLVHGAHGIAVLEKSVLGVSGFYPIRRTLIGRVEGIGEARLARYQKKLRRYGEAAF